MLGLNLSTVIRLNLRIAWFNPSVDSEDHSIPYDDCLVLNLRIVRLNLRVFGWLI